MKKRLAITTGIKPKRPLRVRTNIPNELENLLASGYLTQTQAAKYKKVSRNTIFAWQRRGKLPFKRLKYWSRGVVLCRKEDLDKVNKTVGYVYPFKIQALFKKGYLTQTQAAAYKDVCQNTILRWERQGELPVQRFKHWGSGMALYSKGDLDNVKPNRPVVGFLKKKHNSVLS